jgi:argininosuccinate synthase
MTRMLCHSWGSSPTALMPRFAELIYKGARFPPRVVSRPSPKSLYSLGQVTFEGDAIYDQRDAESFIRLNALRLRLAARRDQS